MRVLHLASWYPNREHTQLGNFVRRHIEALPTAVESTVLHVWPSARKAREVGAAEPGSLGPSSIREVISYVKNLPPRHWRTEWAYHKHMSRLRKEGYVPDLVHLHVAAEAARPALKAAQQWNAPLVVSENWTAYHGEHGRSFRLKEERAVRDVLSASSLHLPVSHHLGRAMARYAPGVRQKVVPNVVDDRFGLPVHPRSEDGPLRLLHVSSMLDAHKDISGMLQALGDAVQRGADLVMDCFGGAGAGADDIAGYRRLVQSLGLAERVRFMGPAGPDEVVGAMHAADVFVLFSRYENLPCVLLEAWMTGLPTVATDVGGVGEHLGVNPALGTLLTAGDIQGLADALVGWHARKQDRNLPNGLAIGEYARARFSNEAVGGAFLEAYRSVLR